MMVLKNRASFLPLKHVISQFSSRRFHQHFTTACDSGQECVDWKRDSDIDLLVEKIPVGSTEDEVYQLLSHDPACNATRITHELIDKLLNRFKDDWKSALGVFRWAESRPEYEPLPEFYDKVVDTLGKMKQMEKMVSFVEEMSQNQNRVSLNTIAKVMRRFAGAGEWKDAILTFDRLENFGLEKNTESMNVLLDTLCKEKRVDQAREVFFKLKAHLAPNEHTFNIFIHGWCNLNRVEEAHWTIQEMKGHGCPPSVISYSTIVQFYSRRADFVKVYEVLDEMEEEGCPPNVVTYTAVMNSLTKCNAFEEALKVSERMKSAGCKKDTLFFNSLLHTLGRAGRVQEAVRCFIVEMPEFGVVPNTYTYNTMIAMLCHNEQEEAALEFLKEMENSRVCNPDVQTFFPLLKSCFRPGKKADVIGMKKLLHDMSHKHHLSFDLSTYALLIHGFCKVNKAEEAYELFVKMTGQGIMPRYVTCRILLEAVRGKNMYHAADRVEDFMKKMKSSSKKQVNPEVLDDVV